MKKIIKLIILFILITITIITLLLDPILFFKNITNTFEIWLYKVYPSIFVFYILSSILINSNVLNKVLSPIYKLLNFETLKAKDIFITSIFNGNPSTSMIIIDNLNNKEITMNDSRKLLKIASFFNPIFIILFISLNFSSYLFTTIIILIIHILSNAIISLFIKNMKNIAINKKTRIDFEISMLFDSFNNVIKLLLMVLSIMIFMNIIRYSIIYIFNICNINNIYLNLLVSQIEVTTGLEYLFSLQINNCLKLSILSFMVAFGGLSIHMQVYNVIYKYDLKYKTYLIYRLLQGIIAFLLTFLFFMNNL